MRELDRIFADVLALTKKEVVQKAILDIQAIVEEENRFNLQAQIKLGQLDEEELEVGELECWEDYEIITGSYTVEDGEEFTSDERDERMEELRKQIDKLEEKEKDTAELEAELEQLEDAEFEYDEIYWNTVFRYRGKVNVELAQRLDFGVLELMRPIPGTDYDEGDQFMFLQGCGMDLSPKYAAYQALEFGCVDGFAHKFREPGYFKSVVGEEIFGEVCEALGITECIETAEEDAKRRMEEFDDQIKAIGEARDSGKMDQTLAGVAAMMAFAKSQE